MEILPEKSSDSAELALTENMELQELSTSPPPAPVSTATLTSSAISSSPPKAPQHRKVSVRFKTPATTELYSSAEPAELLTLTIFEADENNQEVAQKKEVENVTVQQQKIEPIIELKEVGNEDEDEGGEKTAKSANLSGILRKVGSSLIGRPTGPTPPGGRSPFVSTFVTGRAESTSTLERFIFNLVIIGALMMLMGFFLGGRYLWYRYVDWI